MDNLLAVLYLANGRFAPAWLDLTGLQA